MSGFTLCFLVQALKTRLCPSLGLQQRITGASSRVTVEAAAAKLCTGKVLHIPEPEPHFVISRFCRMRPNDPPEDDTDAAKKLLARSEELCSVSSSASFQSKRSVETELSPKAARMLEDVRRLAMDNPEGARGAALWLVALLTSRALSKPGRTKGGLAAWQQRKIEQYLKEILQHPLRVDELAQRVPLSVSYFCRALKKTFGTSPHEYVIQLRLERSRELMLCMSRYSI
jgi:regulatory helix-turn-helix AraC family protein